VSTRQIRSFIFATLVIGISVITSIQPVVNAATVTCAYESVTTPTNLTQIAKVPIDFSETDGDILGAAVGVSGSTNLLAIGGNFNNVIVNDIPRPAKNFAILNEDTGALIYGATDTNSYVRTIAYDNGYFYVGGEFTRFDGNARNYLAAMNATSHAVTNWTPQMSAKVRALAVGPNAVYAGGWSSSIVSYDKTGNGATGAQQWAMPVVGGAVEALTLSPSKLSLYVGGLFEKISTYSQHGLIRVNPDTGVPYTAFKPVFRTDSGVGNNGFWDGENPLSFDWDTSYSTPRLIVSYANNGIVSLNPSTGAANWDRKLEGDGQGVGVVGSVYVAGYHRNHINDRTGCAYKYFGQSFGGLTGKLLTDWDPKLSGTGGNVDGGNGGVQEIVVNEQTKHLIMMGAFTTHGASCPPTIDSGINCTGGTIKRSIAVFNYN
jgi:hypothetical protein